MISHHLFVAAVDHERRDRLKPPRNPVDEESSARRSTPAELPTGEFDQNRAFDTVTGSLLASET
jgi:hypothetical protein